MMYPLQTQQTQPKRTVKPWMIAGLAVFALFAVCGVVASMMPSQKPAAIVPVSPGSGEQNVGDTPVSPAAAKPAAPTQPAAPKSITIAGKNNSVLPVGATLNGAFTVTYSFSSWCGIAQFLKADGSDGAKFMEEVNDCAENTDTFLTGSTIVHLTNVTMVRVDNTRGAWSLVFTPAK
jgi:hypothetical protein